MVDRARVQFEKEWLEKFFKEVTRIAGQEVTQEVLERLDPYLKDADDKKLLSWVNMAILTLKDLVSKEAYHAILSVCACQSPEVNLTDLITAYQTSKNISEVHALLHEHFVNKVLPEKELTEEHIAYILENNMGMAGILSGNEIIVKKIPKDFYSYFKADNPEDKRYHYCHCPRVKEALFEKREDTPNGYCHCGAGFYKSMWEKILDKPVDVKILKSVAKGDDVCEMLLTLNLDE